MISPKKLLFQHFSRVSRALGSPARLELLDLAAQGEKAVETLARQAGLSVKNTSAHLRALREAALVSARREGTHVYYSLADPVVHDLLAALQEASRRRLPEVREIVREHFTSPDGLEPVALDELTARLAEGSVTVLDVRPEDEYAQAHIPGALSIPLDQLPARLSELPRDHEFVAYCRGPYCVLAVEASALLRRHGFRVRRLADGLPGWARQGHPVEAA